MMVPQIVVAIKNEIIAATGLNDDLIEWWLVMMDQVELKLPFQVEISQKFTKSIYNMVTAIGMY